MFEWQNLEQGLLYVIEWPLVTSDLDQSALPAIVKLTLSAFIWVVIHQIHQLYWPFQIKLYLPYPQICALFWKPTSSIIYLAASGLNVHLDFYDAPEALYSDQVRNLVALSGMQMTPGSCSKKP